MNATIALILSLVGQLSMAAVLAKEAIRSPLSALYRLMCGLCALLFLVIAILLLIILFNASSTGAV